MADLQKVDRLLKRIDSVPTLPHIVNKLVQVVSSPKTSARDVSLLVQNDQAFSAKILKLVNSAFYGFPQKITTITHATAILGFNTLRSMALSVAVFDMFKGAEYGFDRVKFWKHSIGVGAATRYLSKKIRYSEPEEAFICGLLHDIGKVIMDKYMHEDFLKVLEHAQRNNCAIIEAEKEILGIDHTRIGEKIAQLWNLPAIIKQPIRYHHKPPQDLNTISNEVKIVALVHLANILTRVKKFGFGGDDLVPDLNEELWAALGFNKEDLQKILEDLDREFENTKTFIEMSAV